MTSLIQATAHGLSANDPVRFGNIVPTNTGIDETATYYVLAAGLTANAFAFSETLAGPAFVLAYAITDGIVRYGDDYSVVTDGIMDPPVVPAAPTGLTATSDTIVDNTGTAIPSLTITLTQPTDPTLRISFVEVTVEVDANGDPVWTDAISFPVDAGQNSIVIPGVAGGTEYFVRTYATDVFGNSSSPTAAVSVTTAVDLVAPTTPKTLTVTGVLRGVMASWDVGLATAGDLLTYEVRYALDIGTGLGPDTGAWTTQRTRNTRLFIGGLNPDPNGDNIAEARYWVQVRAIDTSGNVEDLTDPLVPVAVDYITNPEVGWCTAASGDPQLVDGDMVALASLDTTHISTLDAGILKTGHLLISTNHSDYADGIKVYDGTALVGWWDETGLYVYSSADATDYIRLFAGGLTVFLDGVQTTAITTAGINASAITSGALPGGGNLVKNSSFELADFSAAATSQLSDDATADFTATDYGSDVNVTNSNALSITARTY